MNNLIEQPANGSGQQLPSNEINIRPLPPEGETGTWPPGLPDEEEDQMEEPTFIYDEGRFISHQELIKRFTEWKASPGVA